MKVLGFEITRTKAETLSPPWEFGRGGWFPIIREPMTGGWQRNLVLDEESALRFHATWTCVTLIASDISKLRMKLIGLQPSGIWQEIENPAYSPVLRLPNQYQNQHQFWETWILSKLIHGNTYVLKGRDDRRVVNALYVLDPTRVRPLVSTNGSVFYELSSDNLSGLPEQTRVPAREIIHDRWNCLFHPLVGLSPIFAASLVSQQGLGIQHTSEAFFRNKANLSGLLVAPGQIEEATVRRLDEWFNSNFSGQNSGKVGVVGDNLKFESLMMTAIDAQLIEQSKWSAENVCGIFHVPSYKAGIGVMPSQTGIESLNLEYYSQCLQKLMEDAELCLDEGLSLGSSIGVEFDMDGLLRLDSLTKLQVLRAGTEASIMSANEARFRLDLPPVAGGDKPLAQQQYWPLDVLANRPPPIPPSQQPPAPQPTQGAAGDQMAAALVDWFTSRRDAVKPRAERDDDDRLAAEANIALIEILRGLK